MRATFYRNSYGNLNPSYQFTETVGRDHLHLRMFPLLRAAGDRLTRDDGLAKDWLSADVER